MNKDPRRKAANGVLQDHIVICNWNDLGEEIVHQLHASVVRNKRAIVIITDQPEDIPRAEFKGEDDPFHDVFVIPGDPARDKILARASIAKANTAIVLSDPREGEYADTKSVLIALAIESIEPKVHTIVELLHSRSKIHFRHTHVDEVVCVDELTEKLLAQASLTHGLSEFYMRLLTATEDTNEVYLVDVPKSFVGKTYRQLEKALVDYEEEDVVLVGIQTKTPRRKGDAVGDAMSIDVPQLTINPPAKKHLPKGSPLKDRDYVLEEHDKIFVIAYNCPTLKSLKA